MIALKYSVIIPVHNEEKFIRKTLQSDIGQTVLPYEVMIVNDNSTDGTSRIIQEFTENYPFIKTIHSGSESKSHEPGSKIVNAFYKGLEKSDPQWDVIVKLDADAVLPENYFEKIIGTFRSNPDIGIAGGIATIEKNGKWEYEKIGNKKQVRGPFKSYSRHCFEKIGGLRKSIGWDTVDELLAQYYGFEVAVIPDLEVKLLKPTGTDYKKIHGERTGQGFYKMDYGWVISFIAALKASWNAGNPYLFLSISKGYWKSSLNNENKIVSSEEGKFIRNYRRQKILNRFLNRS